MFLPAERLARGPRLSPSYKGPNPISFAEQPLNDVCFHVLKSCLGVAVRGMLVSYGTRLYLRTVLQTRRGHVRDDANLPSTS